MQSSSGRSEHCNRHGYPVGTHVETRGETRFEIVQFGGEEELVAALHKTLDRIVQDYGTTLQKPLEVIRILVTEPGFGGTRVEGAISIGAQAGLPAGGRLEQGLLEGGFLHG